MSLVTCGTCVTPEWRHALDINKWTWEMVFASWRKKSWALDEAIWYSDWNLWMTTVWLNRFWTWHWCLKNKLEEGWLDPRSKLNAIQSTIGTYETAVYYPMIDWKTNKKNQDFITCGTYVTPEWCHALEMFVYNNDMLIKHQYLSLSIYEPMTY